MARIPIEKPLGLIRATGSIESFGNEFGKVCSFNSSYAIMGTLNHFTPARTGIGC